MNEIENIVKNIQFKTGETLEQIALKIGFSRPHLNKAKLSGDGKKVLIALKEKYKKELQNVIYLNNEAENNNIVSEPEVDYNSKKSTIIKKEVDLAKQMSLMQETLIKLQAQANTDAIDIAELRAKVYGTSLNAELSKKAKDVNVEADRLFYEFSKKP